MVKERELSTSNSETGGKEGALCAALLPVSPKDVKKGGLSSPRCSLKDWEKGGLPSHRYSLKDWEKEGSLRLIILLIMGERRALCAS